MTAYANRSGKSGILNCENGTGYITVEFKKPNRNGERFYKYTDSSVGSNNIMTMQSLAIQGQELGSFISSNENIREGYSSKW